MISEAGQGNDKDVHESYTGPITAPPNWSSLRTEAPPEITFTWVDDTRTSSASGGRRGVRRTARDHDKVRRHAATVSAAARLATIRKRNQDTEGRGPDKTHMILRQRSSTSSTSSQGSIQDSKPANAPPWYILRLLGQDQPWYQDAIQFNTVNQKS